MAVVLLSLADFEAFDVDAVEATYSYKENNISYLLPQNQKDWDRNFACYLLWALLSDPASPWEVVFSCLAPPPHYVLRKISMDYFILLTLGSLDVWEKKKNLFCKTVVQL